MNEPDQLRRILQASELFAGRFFSPEQSEKLCRYYQLALKWNPLAHLTTIIEPQAFAQFHLLEAVIVTENLLPEVKRVWDIGSGLGIPGLPLALLKPEVEVLLVEANRRKAIFLEAAAHELQMANLKVKNARFERLAPPDRETALTARAVEKLSGWLPTLLTLAESAAQLLLLGARRLEQATRQQAPGHFKLEVIPIPYSTQRLLLNLRRFT